MTQTRLGSFSEAWANVLVGYLVATAANYFVLPLFGLPVDVGKSALIALVFTLISLVRSYILRRWFNRLRFGNVK